MKIKYSMKEKIHGSDGTDSYVSARPPVHDLYIRGNVILTIGDLIMPNWNWREPQNGRWRWLKDDTTQIFDSKRHKEGRSAASSMLFCR